MRKISLILLVAVSLLLGGSGETFAKKYVLRIGTLAPKGSSWDKVFKAFRWELKKKSKKRLILKLYAGGSMGNEKLMLRKVMLGSLQGAAITSVGLFQIEPSLLALQLPFLFKNYGELDYVREKLDGYIRKKLEKKGFVLLGWADIGYIYIFSKHKLQSMDDLHKAKIWAWTDDPISQAFAKAVGVTPRLLDVLHVRQALQTGTVDTVASTPISLLALQWHPYVKYRIKYRFAIGLGATVLSKKAFDALPPDLQKLLLETSKKYHKKLQRIIRKANKRDLKTLKKFNIKGIKISKKYKKEIKKIARKVEKSFTGKLFPAEDLKKIKELIAEYRKKHKKK